MNGKFLFKQFVESPIMYRFAAAKGKFIELMRKERIQDNVGVYFFGCKVKK
jgi:hypothetical protein